MALPPLMISRATRGRRWRGGTDATDGMQRYAISFRWAAKQYRRNTVPAQNLKLFETLCSPSVDRTPHAAD
jgi:hypothetical protein